MKFNEMVSIDTTPNQNNRGQGSCSGTTQSKVGDRETHQGNHVIPYVHPETQSLRRLQVCVQGEKRWH